MGSLVEIKVPKYPDCWESCGNCANGEVYVQSVLVAAAQFVSRDDTLPTMSAEIRLYSKPGFRPIEPYVLNPIEEGAMFLGLDLLSAATGRVTD